MAFESVIGKKLKDVQDILIKEAAGTSMIFVTEGGPLQTLPNEPTIVVTLDKTGTSVIAVSGAVSQAST